MVLFLFMIMLMNMNEETERHKPALVRMGAVVAAGLLMLVLVAALKRADSLPPAMEQNIAMGTIENLGKVLLGEYLLPFEFVSVLLLSSMIGAVLLAKKDKIQTA